MKKIFADFLNGIKTKKKIYIIGPLVFIILLIVLLFSYALIFVEREISIGGFKIGEENAQIVNLIDRVQTLETELSDAVSKEDFDYIQQERDDFETKLEILEAEHLNKTNELTNLSKKQEDLETKIALQNNEIKSLEINLKKIKNKFRKTKIKLQQKNISLNDKLIKTKSDILRKEQANACASIYYRINGFLNYESRNIGTEERDILFSEINEIINGLKKIFPNDLYISTLRPLGRGNIASARDVYLAHDKLLAIRNHLSSNYDMSR